MASNINYGPITAVAARPIAPISCRKAPVLPPEQHKDMAEACRQKQAALDTEIAQWQEDVIVFSHSLAEKYGRKSKYYLHLMYSHGSKLHTKRKPNVFNAWLHHLVQEIEGMAASLVELEQDNINDYHRLSPAEKAELVSKLTEERNSCTYGVRLNQRGRTQDVNNVVCEDGGIAFLRTSKAQVDWIKGDICDKIHVKLVEITGNKKAGMQYINYEKDIVLRYGIKIHGWTHEKFANPSDLSTSLPPLCMLQDTLLKGTCRFKKLFAAELADYQKAYDDRVAAGEVVSWKPWKDIGGRHAGGGRKKKRACAAEESSESEDEEAEKAPPHKQQRRGPKSAATVPDNANGDATNMPSASQGTPSTVTTTVTSTAATVTTTATATAASTNMSALAMTTVPRMDRHTGGIGEMGVGVGDGGDLLGRRQAPLVLQPERIDRGRRHGGGGREERGGRRKEGRWKEHYIALSREGMWEGGTCGAIEAGALARFPIVGEKKVATCRAHPERSAGREEVAPSGSVPHEVWAKVWQKSRDRAEARSNGMEWKARQLGTMPSALFLKYTVATLFSSSHSLEVFLKG
ncbi:hypothetical protein B0H21DRAFT_713170 [Amylocystis lapponica]|nr:hypothetical protein B0H21DRAFT_713170 [Amylocystis lapponica]